MIVELEIKPKIAFEIRGNAAEPDYWGCVGCVSQAPRRARRRIPMTHYPIAFLPPQPLDKRAATATNPHVSGTK